MRLDPSSSSALSVRALGGIREVAPEAWDALVAQDESPFVEHAWLDALEDTGCVGERAGWVPAHLTVWRGDKLAGACPTYVKTNSAGEFVFDWSWAEFAGRIGIEYYPKLVVAVPFTPATGPRALVAAGEDPMQITRILADASRALCDRINASSAHVLFPRDEEAARWEAQGFLRRDGFQYQWFRRDASSFDDYLARFSSKHRNQIKREIRVVGEAGIDVRPLEVDEYTPEVVRAMYRFYKVTVQRHGPWGHLYLNPRFFERIAQTCRGRLAWVVARRRDSGEVVGGAFNVTKGKRLFGRYWGAEVDVPNLHFVACYYAGIRFCIEHGLDVFEPGAGGEHKRARGFVPTLTHSAHWVRDNRLRNALQPWLTRERAHVAAIVRGDEPDE